MTRLAAIIILLAAFSASAQISPDTGWRWQSALVWQVPEPPKTNVVLSCNWPGSALYYVSIDGMKTWQQLYGNTYIATNDSAMFRAEPVLCSPFCPVRADDYFKNFRFEIYMELK